jgi:hypothetical protein
MRQVCLSLILTNFTLLNAMAQQWEWARKADFDSAYQHPLDICSDNAGNVYTMQTNTGWCIYNSTLLDSGTFIVKYDANGNFSWANRLEGEPKRIHCDEDGYLYVLGNFSSNITIGSFYLQVHGNRDFFIAKINSAGNYVWVKSFGGAGNDYANDFAIDIHDNLFITGSYQGSITFDNYTLTDSSVFSSMSIFLTELNSSGNVQWANSGPYNNPSDSIEFYQGNTIRLSKTGSIYLLGNNVVDQYNECPDYFLMKCNGQGQMQLTRFHFDNCFSNTNALAVDDNSNVFYIFNTTGHYWYTPELRKYDSLLNQQWILPLSDEAYFHKYEIHVGLSTDSAGNIFVAGNFGGGSEIVSDSTWAYGRLLIRTGNIDVLVAKFDANANCQWLKTAGGRNFEDAEVMQLDRKGTLYVAGTYNRAYPSSTSHDTVTFDNNILTNDGDWQQLFIAKLNPPLVTGISVAAIHSGITIFPNPTNSTFNLYCPAAMVGSELKIYNSLGEIVHYQIIKSPHQEIDMSKERKGIYFLKLSDGEVRKIVLN